ncbi:M3 family metallopeptidase [Microbacterium sp. Clip185]|uniref:M3 family metallopeptidase n=1 Tax=Microbacterium sp. Clip185 TaxID=3025663 RepID=UPI002365C789|nr:M3 family metallopeptidase [Microbacterium sp. Clip185]WDG19398.1 M3 family metallopeptidase [Microbacterium sp. Clip185]
MASVNPLLSPSALPYALPDYAAIDPEHYLPAFDEAFRQHRAEVERIVSETAPPTFENTLVALERAGEMLDRVSRTFFTVSSADATAPIQAIEEELAPLLSAHGDAIRLDERLYARVSALHDLRDTLDLDAESLRLLTRTHRELTLAGAGLSPADKRRLVEINTRLSTLTTTFEKHLLADTNELAVHVSDERELEGLAAGERSAAARAAEQRGLDGWLITLPLFTGHPWLASLADRPLRERIMNASRARGGRGGDNDNGAAVREIVRLRAERAALLGFPTHAAAVTADQTAGSPEAVAELLRRLAVPASRNAAAEKAERAQVSGIADLAAHDWAFATEQVRATQLDIDTAGLRPWFEAERVLRDGVFAAATALYGITFTERQDLVAYHPGARVFEVFEQDGAGLGLYILDLYTRDTKRGGAWMNSIVTASELRGSAPVVVNNLNVSDPGEGQPTLLTLDEVTTLFHEFGHALHGLFARTRYPHFAGTAVFRDFVEFPSQVNEMWMLAPGVVENYARHIETDEPLPAAVIERLSASGTFDQGFATSEYLAAAWLDLAWHSLSVDEASAEIDVADFERQALKDIGLTEPAVPPRYSTTYFAHIFSGGYSAGYYSYIWSEVLDADAVEWFGENGGLDRAAGERFRRRLLGVGGAKDPLEAYRDFRGRDAAIEPLLRRRGLDA